ncbi:MAG: hypothetical protein DMG50_23230 [Acidobacteria bacterium]|nr:MAG: hypothetical protein DMG50_23230 [Acidobacteriota bacterium]
MQFDSEKPDKITRGACNDDKVIFENPLNWTTRSFIFAKQREYENGPPAQERKRHPTTVWTKCECVAMMAFEVVDTSGSRFNLVTYS